MKNKKLFAVQYDVGVGISWPLLEEVWAFRRSVSSQEPVYALFFSISPPSLTVLPLPLPFAHTHNPSHDSPVASPHHSLQAPEDDFNDECSSGNTGQRLPWTHSTRTTTPVTVATTATTSTANTMAKTATTTTTSSNVDTIIQ